MKVSRSSKFSRSKLIAPLLTLVWPFLYFAPFVFPWDARFRSVANDFDLIYFGYKPYLLDQLSHFKIPLWSPMEACGFPFYSSPLTQTFYPLNIPLALYYRLAGGYTLLDHQIFTVLGVSIFALGLYAWLRSLGFRSRTAVVAACLFSVSFKMAETFRFPNAVHAAAWYPWLLYAINRIFVVNSRRALRFAALLSFAWICLITAAYPYFLYYSIFLIGPYLTLFLFPRFRRILGNEEPQVHPVRRFAIIAVSFAVGTLVCSPYLYKIKSVLALTSNRALANIDFSTQLSSSLRDTIGSWFFPPAALPEGWYYFGILAAFLVLRSFVVGPAPASRREPSFPLKLALALWLIGVSEITYGKTSPLFQFLWNTLPGFAPLRAWSRMAIIFLPVLAWLFSIALEEFEERLSKPLNQRDLRRELWLIGGLAAGVALLQRYFLQARNFSEYWEWWFRPVNGLENGFIVMTGVAALALFAALRWLKFSNKSERAPVLFSMAILAISTLDLQQIGTRMWVHIPDPQVPVRQRTDVERLLNEGLREPRVNRFAAMTLDRYNAGGIANWYFHHYNSFLELFPDSEERRELLGIKDGKKWFFTRKIDFPAIAPFLADARTIETRIQLVAPYGGDRLEVEVMTPEPGYFSFIDNWDPGWTATVDGRTVQIERLFGTFKSVAVPTGLHRIVFRFRG